MGEAIINLHRLAMPEDYEDDEPVPYELVHRGKNAGVVFLKLSRRTDNIPEGAFAGVFHVTVVRLDNFSDTAGMMDRTDPFVEMRLGNECLKTSVKNNAGGHNVVYDETLSFNKALLAGELKVKVMDSDTLSNDTLGELTVDLHALQLAEDTADEQERQCEAQLKGSTAGQVTALAMIVPRIFCHPVACLPHTRLLCCSVALSLCLRILRCT